MSEPPAALGAGLGPRRDHEHRVVHALARAVADDAVPAAGCSRGGGMSF
jgi:hypothetical protein